MRPRALSFTPDAGMLSRALGLLGASPCLELGEHAETLASYTLHAGLPPEGQTMATWLPAARVPCTFQLLPDRKTVIRLGENVLYADPAMSLSPECPPGVVFLAHYTEDKRSDGAELPRVLVYDIHPTEGPAPPATERYRRLREELARFLNPLLCTVQWVGFRDAAEKFLRTPGAIPHAVQGLLCLTDDPLLVIRPPLSIQTHGLPPQTFDFAPPAPNAHQLKVADIFA